MVYILALKIEIKVLVNLITEITILAECYDYTDIFLFEFIAKFQEYSNCNHVFKLEKSKQPLYNPIYNLQSIEFKILKAYIKINLANNFVQFFKFSIAISILFN